VVKIAGDRVPPELLNALAAEPPPREAILLATVDGRSYPHFALLSYQEMLLVDGHLHLFLYEGSRTAGFLVINGRCTLAFAGQSGVFYVKGDAFQRLRVESLIVFRIEISRVERDIPGTDEEGAAVVSGIRFSLPEASAAHRSDLRDRLRRLLRESNDSRPGS
jgi:hypothetical protein